MNSYTSTLTVNANGYNQQYSDTGTPTSSLVSLDPQTINPGGANLVSCSFNNIHYAHFNNTDSTSSIIITSDLAGSKTASVLLPSSNGESSCKLQWNGTSSFYAWSSPSASILQKFIIPF